MLAFTHAAFAIFLYLILVKFSGFQLSWIYFLIAIFFSTLPDVDIKLRLKHRGILHSLFALFTLFCLCYLLFTCKLLTKQLTLLICLAYGSHLIADSLTKQGIKWFWFTGHVKGWMRTGKIEEYIFFGLLVFLILIQLGLVKFNLIGWLIRIR